MASADRSGRALVAAAPHPGVAHLCAADPVLRSIIGRVGPFGLTAPRRVDAFCALARAIVFQQLSGRAAGTIHTRFLRLFAGRPTPALVLALPDARLRSAGLSRAKVLAVRDLAAATQDGRLSLPLSRRLDD